MSFFSGLVTGLAKSVDDQLKSDILRTQKRMDGMEQYRVTRRRSELEREAKQTKEVKEAMQNLSTFVEGDMFKAKQLFATGGGTVSGATKLYDFLDKNRGALGDDFKIDEVISGLSSVRPEGISEADYIANYVEGAKVIKSQGEMKGSGLLAAFGGDFGKTVDKRVDAQAPLTESKYGTIQTKPLRINYEKLIERQKYKKDNQIKSKSSFEAQYNEFDMAAFYEDDPEEKRKLEKKRDEFYNKYLEDKKLSKSATGKSTTLFSKEPVTGIISKANLAAVDGAGYTEGIGEQMKVLLEGNEGPVFEAKINAMKALRARFKSTNPKDEPILFDAIKAEENLQQLQRNKYINDRETDYIASTKDDDAVVYEKYQTKDVTKGLFAGIPQAASADEQFKLEKKMIKDTAKKEGYTPGKVIEYEAPNGKLLRLIWTGQSLIQ
tara:strand:+ start:221 stop:1528 length:1308 start_codon:yes stop_codon:yes gene_type:complete